MMKGTPAMLFTATTQSLNLRAKLFTGFSDPSRLAILEALRDGPLSVSEIVAATGLSQSNTSNHLGCLHDCGLLAREQQGRHVYYRLSDARVAVLLTLADEVLADVAKGIYACMQIAQPEGGES